MNTALLGVDLFVNNLAGHVNYVMRRHLPSNAF